MELRAQRTTSFWSRAGAGAVAEMADQWAGPAASSPLLPQARPGARSSQRPSAGTLGVEIRLGCDGACLEVCLTLPHLPNPCSVPGRQVLPLAPFCRWRHGGAPDPVRSPWAPSSSTRLRAPACVCERHGTWSPLRTTEQDDGPGPLNKNPGNPWTFWRGWCSPSPLTSGDTETPSPAPSPLHLPHPPLAGCVLWTPSG